jgi:hypothetical protein
MYDSTGTLIDNDVIHFAGIPDNRTTEENSIQNDTNYTVEFVATRIFRIKEGSVYKFFQNYYYESEGAQGRFVYKSDSAIDIKWLLYTEDFTYSTETIVTHNWEYLDENDYYYPYLGVANFSNNPFTIKTLNVGDVIYQNSISTILIDGTMYIYMLVEISGAFYVIKQQGSFVEEHEILFQIEPRINDDTGLPNFTSEFAADFRLFLKDASTIYTYIGGEISKREEQYGWESTQSVTVGAGEVAFSNGMDVFWVTVDNESLTDITIYDSAFAPYTVTNTLPSGILGLSAREDDFLLIACHTTGEEGGDPPSTVYLIEKNKFLTTIQQINAANNASNLVSPAAANIYGVTGECQSAPIEIDESRYQRLLKGHVKMSGRAGSIGWMAVEPGLNVNVARHTPGESSGPDDSAHIIYGFGEPEDWGSDYFTYTEEFDRRNEVEVYVSGDTTTFRFSMKVGDMFDGNHSDFKVNTPKFILQQLEEVSDE